VLEPEPIGQGGFAVVFGGTWNQQATFGRATRSRRIAAKRSLVPGLGAEMQNDMVRELIIMADFPHQNVLILHGVCETPNGFHVVTELMACDLDDVIHENARGVLVHQDVLHAARDVAAGLAHLHENRIMHLDLKPSNVLVSEGRGIIRCKIADFGISKELSHTLTKMTAVVGTCACLAA
jgi:serine/threonine protein kinase